nr:MAG TPA: hypothetical protein [Caudoviricetes sp.]
MVHNKLLSPDRRSCPEAGVVRGRYTQTHI